MPPEAPVGPRDPVELPGGVAGNVGRGEGVRRGVGFAVGLQEPRATAAGSTTPRRRASRSRRDPRGRWPRSIAPQPRWDRGSHTILAQIARTVLGIERVILHTSDTLVGSAGSTSASRQTVVSGGAVKAACEAVLEELFERARRDARLIGSDLGVEDGFVTADGERVAPVEELLAQPIERTRVWRHALTHPLDERGQGDVHVGFLFGAQRAVVDVDEELGLVRVVQLATAQDVGFAINPQSVIGQIEGGSAQGLGLALMEEIQLKDGEIANASFTDYLLPTTLDMPKVEVELVEEPEPGDAVRRQGRRRALQRRRARRDRLGAPRRARARAPRIPVRPDDLVGLREPVGSRRGRRSPNGPRASRRRRPRGSREPGSHDLRSAWSAPGVRDRGALVTLLVWLAGCTSDGGGSTDSTGPTSATGSTAPETEPPAPEAIPLEVFVYNVEYGGDESTDAVIGVWTRTSSACSSRTTACPRSPRTPGTRTTT